MTAQHSAEWHANEAIRLARKAQLFVRISITFAALAVLSAVAGIALRLIGGAS